MIEASAGRSASLQGAKRSLPRTSTAHAFMHVLQCLLLGVLAQKKTQFEQVKKRMFGLCWCSVCRLGRRSAPLLRGHLPAYTGHVNKDCCRAALVCPTPQPHVARPKSLLAAASRPPRPVEKGISPPETSQFLLSQIPPLKAGPTPVNSRKPVETGQLRADKIPARNQSNFLHLSAWPLKPCGNTPWKPAHAVATHSQK